MSFIPNKWKSVIDDYFRFSKYQRRAVTVLLVAIVIVFIAPTLWQYFAGAEVEKADAFLVSKVNELKPFDKEFETNTDRYKKESERSNYKSDFTKDDVKLFEFDPNTASVSDWVKMGVREKTALTIQNYLKKGGKFQKPEDLRKIYGLSSDLAEKLIPYVQIPKNNIEIELKHSSTTNNSKSFLENNKTFIIDVNAADTTILKRLPGIGSTLAARIVNYRNKLGGFHSIHQVRETYGISDSVFQTIKPMLEVKGTVRKIHLNTATATELKMPYLNYNVVNAILQYRAQHGDFQSVSELKKIMLIDEDLFAKIAPYITID